MSFTLVKNVHLQVLRMHQRDAPVDKGSFHCHQVVVTTIKVNPFAHSSLFRPQLYVRGRAQHVCGTGTAERQSMCDSRRAYISLGNGCPSRTNGYTTDPQPQWHANICAHTKSRQCKTQRQGGQSRETRARLHVRSRVKESWEVLTDRHAKEGTVSRACYL